MVGCCQPEAYERLFGARQARLDAGRYRKRGLGGTSRCLVELAGDVSETTVLEVGGGVGAIELELLAAGADRATNVELSGQYEEEAATLLAERGLSDRVDRLVGVAAACTRRRLLLTIPQERPWTRAGIGAINLFLRLTGSGFRAFVHPFAAMRAAADREGLSLERRERNGLIWESVAFVRSSPS